MNSEQNVNPSKISNLTENKVEIQATFGSPLKVMKLGRVLCRTINSLQPNCFDLRTIGIVHNV